MNPLIALIESIAQVVPPEISAELAAIVVEIEVKEKTL